MPKSNIFLIFALFLLICSIDMVLGNALMNQKKLHNNHIDRKFPRKLNSPGKIIIGIGNEIDCSFIDAFIAEDTHPSRKFISTVNLIFEGREIQGAGAKKCYSYIKLVFYFSDRTNSLENIFGGQENLKNNIVILDLTAFDISVVESFKDAFKDLPNLGKIIFPTDKTVKPKNVDNMFSGCSSLTSLDLSMFDLSNCDSFTEMINECTTLRNLILRDFNFKNEDVVKNILSKDFII